MRGLSGQVPVDLLGLLDEPPTRRGMASGSSARIASSTIRARPRRRRSAFRGRTGGQSMIEFALVAPTLLLLCFGTLEFCLLLFGSSRGRYAANEGARAASEAGSNPAADLITV